MFAVVSQRALAAGLLVCTLFASAASASHEAVEWKVSEGGNGHFYEVAAIGPYHWEDASIRAGRSTRDGLTGYLATITSAEEQAFIQSLLPQTLRQYYFIGGVQDPAGAEPDGGWSWVTGEPWSYTHWSAVPPEPNDYDGEDYLTLQSPNIGGGGWNDIGGDAVLAGVVIEYGTVPEPTGALLLPVGLGLLLRRRARG
jgi:hypothetical protein